MKFVYFASVRDAIGCDEEDIDLPASVNSVAECTRWLAARDPRYAHAFAQPEKLRFALDQKMVVADAPIGDAKELAIFPPVTGGLAPA